MMFHVDQDTGTSIRGWIVTENPLVSCKLKVVVGDSRDFVVNADLPRPSIVDLGWHYTGKVGFDIDRQSVPDLANDADVSIFEGESNILVYRRFQAASHLPRRLCIYDNLQKDESEVFQLLQSRFALYYRDIERQSHETIMTLINCYYSESILLYGMPNYESFHGLMADRNYLTAVLMRDPAVVLAGRLLTAQREADPTDPIGKFVMDLDLSSNKDLHRAFRKAPSELTQSLANSMAQALSCGVNEPTRRRSVAIALDRLSNMKVVGVDTEFDLFRDALSDALKVRVLDGCSCEAAVVVAELARRLTEIKPVQRILEDDLILYSFVKHAVSEGIKGDSALN